MKKIFPIAVIGTAVAAAAGYFFTRNNKQHLKETIAALDKLEQKAEATINQLSESIKDDDKKA